jgi:hypothetical protein
MSLRSFKLAFSNLEAGAQRVGIRGTGFGIEVAHRPKVKPVQCVETEAPNFIER